MKNRVDIKNFILQIEQDFPVNDWKVNGIHLWPYLRIKLFFFCIDQVENPNETTITPIVKSKGIIKKNLQSIRKGFQKIKNYFFYKVWMAKLPHKKYMFLGGNAHRVYYKKALYNRFFDVIIEKNKLQHESIFFEYGSKVPSNIYNKKLVYTFYKPLLGFKFFDSFIKNKCNFEWNGYTDFLDYLALNPVFEEFVKEHSTQNLEKWLKSSFMPRVRFFEKIIAKVKPKQIHILCYYSQDIMALLTVANKNNIKTIEMQHGPQTDIHMSYGNWSKVPLEGYAMLPRIFWQWDAYSKNIVDAWIANHPLYHSVEIGNPWVNYWKEKKMNYEHKNYILYSLQPKPITLEKLFPQQLISFIKEEKYVWFLRLHPRQFEEKEKIKKYLKEKLVLDLVVIEEATNKPLPLLLSNCLLHITHSSGAAIEAESFNVFSVILNQIGVSNFPNLLEEEKAIYIDYSSNDFKEQFKKIVQKQEQRVRNSIFVTKPNSISFE